MLVGTNYSLVGSEDETVQRSARSSKISVQGDSVGSVKLIHNQEYNELLENRKRSLRRRDLDRVAILALVGIYGCIFGVYNCTYSMTHTYKVYSRESPGKFINIHYRPGPGCTKNSEADCVKTIPSDGLVVISSLGPLERLCASDYTMEDPRRKCATWKGLWTDADWHVHDGLVLTRGEGSSNSASVDSTANTQDFGVTFTDAEVAKMVKSAVTAEKNVTQYLRGSNSTDKWNN